MGSIVRDFKSCGQGQFPRLSPLERRILRHSMEECGFTNLDSSLFRKMRLAEVVRDFDI